MSNVTCPDHPECDTCGYGKLKGWKPKKKEIKIIRIGDVKWK